MQLLQLQIFLGDFHQPKKTFLYHNSTDAAAYYAGKHTGMIERKKHDPDFGKVRNWAV